MALLEDDDDGLDGTIACWCGATGTFDELFDEAVFEENCGGLGRIECLCGGDFCVCHHHGSAECPGCADCEPDDGENEGWEEANYEDEP